MKIKCKTIMAVTAFLLLGILTACSRNAVMVYGNYEEYNAGNCEISETVEAVEITWSDGNVVIGTSGGDYLSAYEETKEELTEDMKMHWWLDGKTLHIQYCESGKSFFRFGGGKKNLKVLIPDSIRLSDVKVSASSAEIEAESLTADSVSISTSSGSILLSCDARQINLDSSSGEITLKQTGESENIKAVTSSGTASVFAEKCSKMAVETSSGEVYVTGKIWDELNISSSSGSVTCDMEKLPMKTDIDTSSGKVKMLVPHNPGFEARIDTASGDFDSDFAYVISGDTYKYGNGAADISINTSSGSIEIMQKQ